MTRSKKALLTSVTSTLHQIIAIVCGFILPRLFLTNYGSAVNGLVSSITKFLEFISLAELGVGVVVQSSLYKPLAIGDNEQISKIFKSANRFFNKLGIILLLYTLVLTVTYPSVVSDSFDYLFTGSLVLIISISTFSQYYIGITYRMVLGADQYGFIAQTISCITLVLNTIICIVLINLSFSIHVVKAASSLIFLTQPCILLLIGKKKYSINKKVILTEEPIKQKWNGVAQHFAAVINQNTDIVVLTLLSTLENVSVYYVYNIVVSGVKSIITSLTSGYIAMFGNMIAKNETDRLNKTFNLFEWIIHTATTIAFSMTGILIVPFVKLYTMDIIDANYIVPVFAGLITIAQAAYCLRLPYNIIIMSAGHYKETQVSAIVEAVINVVISVVFVFKLGLVGVAIGTLVAMVYRTVYLAIYLKKNIVFRSLSYFIKQCIVDLLTALLISLLIPQIINMDSQNYGMWICKAAITGVISVVICFFVNYMFYRKNVGLLFSKVKKQIKKT